MRCEGSRLRRWGIGGSITATIMVDDWGGELGSWKVGKLGSWEDLCVRVSVRVSLEVSGGEGYRGREIGGSTTATRLPSARYVEASDRGGRF